MTLRVLRLVLVLLLASTGAASAQLRGQVLDAESGHGVAGAIVRLSGRTAERTTHTDAAGSYRFATVEPGDYVVTVLHPGYERVRIRIAIRWASAMTLDMPLEPRPVRIRGLTVRSARDGGAVVEHAATDSVDLRNGPIPLGRIAHQSAGALGDFVLADLARTPPRDEPGGRRPHVLYVWGSSAERGRVVLDGATVNAPLQLGGILPPLDPDVLARAELRTGGTSPRYDGGTRYIMDFRTRPATTASLRARGQLDLLSASALVEAPVGESAGFLIAGRRVNSEVVQTVLDRRFGYGYTDGIARLQGRAPGGELAATAFATRESIRLPRDVGEDRAAWENVAAALTWSGTPSDRVESTVHASCSRGMVDVPLLSAPGGHLRATADRCAALAERRWTASTTSLATGIELEHLRFVRRSSADADPRDPGSPARVACTESLPCAHASATIVSPYGEVAWQPGRRVSMRAGVRASYRSSPSGLSLLPRLAVSWVNASGNTRVTLSGGRFSQTGALDGEREPVVTTTVPRAQDSGWTEGGGATAQPQPMNAMVAYATQLELAVMHRSARAVLAGSALLHRHDRDDAARPFASPGADLSWAYGAGAWRVMLGYSVLARPRSPQRSGFRFQHLASAGAGVTHGRVAIELSSAYGHGVPLASIVLESPEVTGPLPSGRVADPVRTYLRVDGAISAEWQVERAGRPLRITPYARVLNGLSRRDALFYFDDDATAGEPRPLAALPALPVLGLRLAF